MTGRVVVFAVLILLAGCSTTATTSTPTATPTPTSAPTGTPTPLPDQLDVTFTLTCNTHSCWEFAEGPTYIEIRKPVQNDSGDWRWATMYYGPIDDSATVTLDTDGRYQISIHGNEDSFAWRTDGTVLLGSLHEPRQREYHLVVANCCSDYFSDTQKTP